LRQRGQSAALRKVFGGLITLAAYDAILFDFDGVLADTEPVHFRCWREVLAGFGVTLEWEWFAQNCIGVSEHDTIQAFRFLVSPPLDFEPLWEQYPRKKQMFRQLIADGVPMAPGIRELLEELRGRYRMAVVSSSARVEVQPALEVARVIEYFDALVCGSEVPRLKPAPDPYLRAAELLASKHPLVVEDSLAGVASAQSAGFEFVHVASVAETVKTVRKSLSRESPNLG
jgi:HAD superfamily hydrolase (TIGR01509 family)